MFDRLSGKRAREVKITEKSSEKLIFVAISFQIDYMQTSPRGIFWKKAGASGADDKLQAGDRRKSSVKSRSFKWFCVR
jgi:hypothetical protein